MRRTDELFAICSTYEVDDGGARGLVLARPDETGASKPWPILITRKANNFYGFENACPHQGSRLDTVPGEFLDEDGNFITCGNHHAQFDLDKGRCFIGPCQGQDLTPIKLMIDCQSPSVTSTTSSCKSSRLSLNPFLPLPKSHA